MIVCATCATEMACAKTGTWVHFGGGHCYAGDRFYCKECGANIVRCNDSGFHTDAESLRKREAEGEVIHTPTET